MAYETASEVMLGVYTKLLRQRDNLTNKIAELTLQIKLLENADLAGTYEIAKELDKKKDDAESKLYDVELQLKVIQKKRDGGASLDPFLGVKTSLREETE